MPLPAILSTLLKGILGKSLGAKAVSGVAKKKAVEGAATAAATNTASTSGLGKVLSSVLGTADTASPKIEQMKAVTNQNGLMEQLIPKASRQAPINLSNLTQKELAQAANKPKFWENLMSGESLGSKIFLNTLTNFGQSGGFTRSDVGQPDRDFSQMLANSLASSIGGSVMQQKKQNFEDRQMLMNMANDFDYSAEIMKTYQPEVLNKINGFRDKAVNAMAENRKRGINYLRTEDMQNLQWEYVGLKKQLDKFNSGVQQLQAAQSKLRSKENQGGYWSTEKFNMAVDYFRKTGEPPAEGFLYPNPMNPEEYASTLKVTDVSRWTRGGEDNFTKVSPLTDQQRIELLFADLAANPRVRAWYEEQGLNIDDPETRYREAAKYAPQVEKPIPDYDALMKWQTSQEEKAYRREEREAAKAAKLAAEENKRGFKEVPDYLGQGKSILFTQPKTTNVDKPYLEKILGKTITSADNVVPISLERIDNQGKVYVTYEDATGKNSAAIPLDKGAGLVDTYYPGASEAGKAIISGEPAKENKKGLFERLSGNVESYVYEMNGERFAIPKDQADEFLKDNPTAKRIK